MSVNPNLWSLKMLKDLSPEDLEKFLPASEWQAIKQKLSLSRRRNLELATDDDASLLLPTLNSSVGSYRPAGQVKLDVRLRELGIVPNGSYLSAEAMCLYLGFPPEWTSSLYPFYRGVQGELELGIS